MLCALAVYYICPQKYRWVILLAANVVFYAFGGVQYMLYILAAIVISYFAALYFQKLHDEQKALAENMERAEKKELRARMTKQRKKVLVPAMLVVLGFLAVVKYSGFFMQNIASLAHLLGSSAEITPVKITAPLGMSYYTFTVIAYLMDVYRGNAKAQKNFAKYALYISFFPQMTMGPIVRYKDVAHQLYEGSKLNFDNLRFGAQLILWGLFKKLVLGDRIALLVNTVYGNYEDYSGLIFVFATLLYSIQIYADFSGYMDIARGCAQMFGITLPENFLRPYFSRTMPEFWRRWHATLGSFFKDYVFYPVSVAPWSIKLNQFCRKKFGNEAGRIVSICIPVLAVWFLTGLWHGASWRFIFWGLFHGLMIMLSSIFTPLNEKITKKLNIKTDNFSWHLFQSLRTFFICGVGRVFFCSGSIRIAFSVFARIFTSMEGGLNIMNLGITKRDYIIIIAASLALLLVSALQEKHGNVRELIAKQNLVFRWAIWLVLLFAVILFGQFGVSSNTGIYEQF